MRILVCGGRDYKDWDYFRGKVWEIMDQTIGPRIPFEIISGEARGADRLAKKFAERHDLKYTGYPANWKEEGKKAGYLRNLRMLKEGKPDLVIAFPGGKGTANMVKIAKEANIEVREII